MANAGGKVRNHQHRRVAAAGLRALVAVALPCWGLACTGTIDDPAVSDVLGSGGDAGGGGASRGGAGGGSAGSGGDTGGAGGTISSGGTGGGVQGKVCGTFPLAASGPGPAPMRKLTRAEYNNTVFDLLGDDSNPSAGFIADQRVHGFDNNASVQIVTATQVEDYLGAAESLAGSAVSKPSVVPACTGGATGEEGCARTFAATFGKRAYRRPLTDAEVNGLVDLYKAARAQGGDHQIGMKSLLTSILQSPYFIYRLEFGEGPGGVGLTSWEMASRLSYLVWNTMPDPALFAAAESDALKTPAQVAGQAQRMLKDAKAHRMVQNFHDQWLGLYKLDTLTKDDAALDKALAVKSPSASFSIVRDYMKEETRRFMENAFWQGDGSAQKLFTSPQSFMNKELATYLGMPSASTMKPGLAGFAPVALNSGQRVGLMTQAGLLAAYAKPTGTLPVTRGKFVLEQLLCFVPPPPPPNVNNTPPDPKPGQTTRERFTDHLKAECATCHRIMDPVGFAFESFDAAGRWRTMEAGKPVDTTGTLMGLVLGADADVPVSGAVELSNIVAGNAGMKKCVAKQWLRFALGREEVRQDEKSLEQLFCAFEDANFNMRDLVVALTQTDTFLGRP